MRQGSLWITFLALLVCTYAAVIQKPEAPAKEEKTPQEDVKKPEVPAKDVKTPQQDIKNEEALAEADLTLQEEKEDDKAPAEDVESPQEDKEETPQDESLNELSDARRRRRYRRVRCPLHGIDFNGHDISHKRHVRSWRACSNFCRRTYGCRVWTWNKHEHVCWVKRSAAGLVRHRSGVSGTKSCGARVPCPEHGIDYNGHDIRSRRHVRSWRTCSFFCRRTYGCKVWTWNKHEHVCWMKKSAAGRVRHRSGVSGTRSCGGRGDEESNDE